MNSPVYGRSITKKEDARDIFKRPTAKVEPDSQGASQEVVAFTSSDGKFRTRMYRAGPEH